MSCHSCHTDGHSNFTRNDNLSDNSFGAPKLVISLLGRKGTAPFAWSGDVPDLASQIRNSIHKTMQSDIEQLPDDEVNALAAYIDSLPPPPSVDALRGTADRAAIERGQKLFAAHDCARCHAPPLRTGGRRRMSAPKARATEETGRDIACFKESLWGAEHQSLSGRDGHIGPTGTW